MQSTVCVFSYAFSQLDSMPSSDSLHCTSLVPLKYLVSIFIDPPSAFRSHVFYDLFCLHLRIPFTTFLIPFLVSGPHTHSPLSFLFFPLVIITFAVQNWLIPSHFLFHSFSHTYLCFPAPFVEVVVFYAMHVFGTFIENIVMFSCLYFWCFCSSPLIYTSVFLLIPQRFLLWLSGTIEIRYCKKLQHCSLCLQLLWLFGVFCDSL